MGLIIEGLRNMAAWVTIAASEHYGDTLSHNIAIWPSQTGEVMNI